MKGCERVIPAPGASRIPEDGLKVYEAATRLKLSRSTSAQRLDERQLGNLIYTLPSVNRSKVG